MALAGLWENWRSLPGEWVRSFAIITTTPNELCAELHDRMPVVLSRDVWPESGCQTPSYARRHPNCWCEPEFAADSSLEGSGFELAVPPPRERPFRGGRLGVLETLQAVASFVE